MNHDDYRKLGYRFIEDLDPNFGEKGLLYEVSRVSNRDKDTIIRLTAQLLEMIAETDRKPITGGYN